MFKWIRQPSEKEKGKKNVMFKWLRQPSDKEMGKGKGKGKGKEKEKEGKKRKKRKQKQETRQLWDSEFTIVDRGLDEEQIVSFIDDLVAQQNASRESAAATLRQLLTNATTSAEQVAANIKARAETEAKAEAARIVTQSSQEAQAIKREAELASQKEAEDILSVASRKAEITEAEATQKALLFLLTAREEIEEEVKEDYQRAYSQLSTSLQNLANEGENIEAELKKKRAELWQSKGFELKEYEVPQLSISAEAIPPPETSAPTETETKPDITTEEKPEQPTQLQEEIPEEKPEQPGQVQEEIIVSEVVETTTEEVPKQTLAEERPDGEEIDPAQLEQDSQTLYAGEVELAIDRPVDPKMMSKLHNYLQTTPEVKLAHTSGSWDKGTIMTIALDKPIPLISELSSKIPEAKATPERPEKSTSGKGKKGIRRIKLSLKEG